MVILGFLLGSTLLNLVLGFLVQFKSYQKQVRRILLGLSVLFTLYLWISYFSIFNFAPQDSLLYQKICQCLDLGIALATLELTRHFLHGGALEPEWTWGRSKITLFSFSLVGTVVGLFLIWVPGMVVLTNSVTLPVVRFVGPGLFIPALRALVAVYTLYLLESTYRFSKDYQRRIARLCFIGLGCLSVFHILNFSYVLIFNELALHFNEASSVIYGVTFPVVLAGFLRYRLASESISVPRGAIYTSATIFLTGAAFLGVAFTILVFQWLHLDLNYFERFLLGFTLCFFAVLVLGSGTMRKRISRFVNEQFYSRKYDYQEQFFRLHKSAMTGSDVHAALTELIENMKYSVTVDDAYFFVLDWQDGNFYQHENKEEATQRGLLISGDSPLVQLFAHRSKPVDLLAHDSEGMASRTEAREEPLVYQLKFDAIFPIFLGDRLAGLLILQGGRAEPFDEEDLNLIAVFTTSIGDVLFKNRVMNERIEKKQIESFHHVASFIIHDIKNQVATLNLLLKNAERNLENPSFQASMLSSVKSCAGNLQGLIDRLSVAPKAQEKQIAAHPLRPLLEEVVANSGLSSLPDLTFELNGESQDLVSMDRQALFFVVRNLINNSLEAMGSASAASHTAKSPGHISVSYGSLTSAVPSRLRELFGGGDRFFNSFGAYILVEDNGVGMDEHFVRQRLFQPFATTKEKGVGIGLYQCKTLIEKMAGRIVCHSVPGRGTAFCILLPSASKGF